MTISPEEFEIAINPEQAFVDTDAGFIDAVSVPQVRGESASKLYAGQAAMINGSPDNGEIVRLEALQPDSKDSRKSAVQEFYGRQQQALAAWLEGGLSSNPNEVEETLATAQGIQQQIIDDSTGVTQDELAYVKTAGVNGQDELQRRLAFQMAAMNDINDMVDSQGWLETFADFGGSMIPFGYAIDVEDIDEAIKATPQLAEIEGANLEEIMMNWHGLPVERQEAIFPFLKDAVIEATKTGLFGIETDGNLLKAQGLLLDILDPEGASGVRGEQFFDVSLGVADVLPVGTISKIAKMTRAEKMNALQVLSGTVTNLRSKTSAAKVALDAGDVENAAIHTVTAMTDDDVATAMNKTRTSAALDAMPIQTSEWFKEVIDDDALPNEVARKLNEAAYKAQQFQRSLTGEQDFMQIGALNKSERQQVIANWNDVMFKKGEDYLTEGLEMSNLKIVKEDNTGFTYEYRLGKEGDPAPGELQTGQVKFSINDVTGNYEATVDSVLAQRAGNLVSPSTWAATGKTGDFNAEVKRAIASSDVADAISVSAGEMLKWAAEPLVGFTKGGKRAKVEDVLLAGDEFVNEGTAVKGRTFTPTELASGIETKKGTVRLTAPDEVEAYYRMRMYADNAFQTENHVLRREMELGGFKEVRMFGAASDTDTLKNVRMAATSVGKPFDTVDGARSSLRDKAGHGVWDDTAGEVITWSDDYLDEVYESGDQIVRLRKDWNVEGTGELAFKGERVSYVRVKAKQVNDLPEQVLHYKPGYVPKDNVANFAVKQIMPVSKRGVANASRTQAVRLFASKADAERFANEKIANYAQKHDVSFEEASRVFNVSNYDELTTAERLEDAVGGHGGLYHGERSKDELLFGLSGQDVERKSPFEAFQRQASHLGTFVSRNEVRVASEKRWLNTVRREFPEIKLEGFDGTRLPNTSKAKALEKMRNQIKEWNGIPERGENLFQATMQNMHDWMLNGIRRTPFGLRDKESIKSLQWLQNKNPLTVAKGLVMHSFLGVLSPVQFATQASALTVAMSRLPLLSTQIPKALGDTLYFTMLDNIREGTILGKVGKLLKTDEMSPDVESAYNAWRRTGLYESVFNNADTTHLTRTGLGMTMRTLAKAENISLMVYRAGELTNRRFSFMASFNTWAKRTGRTDPSNDELLEIVTEANRSMLELNAANRAWWQGGYGTSATRQIIGTSTQFYQVLAKTVENIFKGEKQGGFSLREKGRILAGQTLLFGAAGVPFGSLLAPAMLDWLGIDEVNDETAQAINQGLVGVTVNNMFDMDNQISNRFALGSAVTDLAKDILTNDDPMFVKALGAAGGLGSRLFQAYSELSPLLLASRAGEIDLTTEDIRLGMAVLAQIPSSTRNLLKAYVMQNHNLILDRRGRPVVSKDFDTFTEIFTGIGFQPTAEARTRVLQWTNKETEALIDETVSARVTLMHKAIYVEKLDPTKVASYLNAMQILDETLPEYVQAQVRMKLIERVYGDKPQTLEEKEIKKFIERTAADKITEDAIIDSAGFGGKDVPVYKPFKDLLSSPQEQQ